MAVRHFQRCGRRWRIPRLSTIEVLDTGDDAVKQLMYQNVSVIFGEVWANPEAV
jgi:hypothetical protein